MTTTISALQELLALAADDLIVVRDHSEATVEPVKKSKLSTLIAYLNANLTFPAPWTNLAVTATTSGTAIDFNSIPSGTTEIEIWFDRVSFNSADDLLVQIGTGGVPTASGYSAGSGTAANVVSTAGFPVYMADAAHAASGVMRLWRIDTNDWVSSHSIFMRPSDGLSVPGGGAVTLAAELDNIRITSIAGTQAFDAGQLRVRYR